MTAKTAEQKRFKMTFTIDTDNNISAFATPEEAAASTATPFEFFASQKEWPSWLPLGQRPA
jgi:hypothetical protein